MTAGGVSSRQWRRLAIFVTLPGVLLGTASVTAAYAAGWMTRPAPKPACTPVVVPAPTRGSFTIDVMNATGQEGVAARVAAGLAERKFTIHGVSNAPESWYVTQSAVIHHGPQGLDQALLVASQIPGATLFDDGRAGSTVDVVVGLAYKDLAPIPPQLKPIPSEVEVNIYNTTYKAGLAKTVADAVSARGFKVKAVSNDPLRTTQLGTAAIRYGEQGNLAAALLRSHVPGAELVKDNRLDASLDLVIGNAYTGLTPASQIPPPQPRPRQHVATVARPCAN